MEFKEINAPGVIFQQIDHEGTFAYIADAVGNIDIVYPDVNFDVSYEDTLEDIEKIRGSVPFKQRVVFS